MRKYPELHSKKNYDDDDHDDDDDDDNDYNEDDDDNDNNDDNNNVKNWAVYLMQEFKAQRFHRRDREKTNKPHAHYSGRSRRRQMTASPAQSSNGQEGGGEIRSSEPSPSCRNCSLIFFVLDCSRKNHPQCLPAGI